jgi:DNA-binding transcriptional ArsR family regulator
MTAHAPALHRALAVLAPPRRFQLMLLLLSGPDRSVSQLARAVRLSQSCTTRHLQALQRAGLVKGQRDGKRVVFRPSPRDATARAVIGSLGTLSGLERSQRLDPVLAAGIALGAIPVASAAEFEVPDERAAEPPARLPRSRVARPRAPVAPPQPEPAQDAVESGMNSDSASAPVARWSEIEDFLL